MKRIFISSTFKDFQEERDLLMGEIYSELNALAKKRGEYFSFQDLRWGIDTDDLGEEDSSIKVINYCLDEVERSKPYFILFLGDYYGYKVDEEIVKREANRHGLYLEDYNISMTELEVRYAMKLIGKDSKHVAIFIRTLSGNVPNSYPSGDDEYQHLKKLKEYLTKKYPECVEAYTLDFDNLKSSLRNLNKLLRKSLSRIVKNEFNESKRVSRYEKDQERHLNYFIDKGCLFRAREDEKDRIHKEISNNNLNETFVIEGESGSGKSTLLAKIAVDLVYTKQYNLFLFECGLTSLCGTTDAIKESIIELSKKRFGIDATDRANYDNQSLDLLYSDTLKKLNELDKKTYIVIDGLNQLMAANRDDYLDLIVPFLQNVVFIASRIPDGVPLKFGIKSINLEPLDDESRRMVVDSLLSRLGKELNERVIKLIVDLESSRNPFYIELAVSCLSLLNKSDYQAINAGRRLDFSSYLRAIVKNLPYDLEDIAYRYITSITHGDEILSYVLTLIAFSKNGLSIEEIDSIFRSHGRSFNEAKNRFYYVTDYNPDFFILYDNGRYDFFHSVFKTAFKKHYDVDSPLIYQELLEHSLDHPDEVCYYTYKLKNIGIFLKCATRDESINQIVSELILEDNGQALIDGIYILISENAPKNKREYVEYFKGVCSLSNYLYSKACDTTRKIGKDNFCKMFISLLRLYHFLLPIIITSSSISLKNVCTDGIVCNPYESIVHLLRVEQNNKAFIETVKSILELSKCISEAIKCRFSTGEKQCQGIENELKLFSAFYDAKDDAIDRKIELYKQLVSECEQKVKDTNLSKKYLLQLANARINYGAALAEKDLIENSEEIISLFLSGLLIEEELTNIDGFTEDLFNRLFNHLIEINATFLCFHEHRCVDDDLFNSLILRLENMRDALASNRTNDVKMVTMFLDASLIIIDCNLRFRKDVKTSFDDFLMSIYVLFNSDNYFEPNYILNHFDFLLRRLVDSKADFSNVEVDDSMLDKVCESIRKKDIFDGILTEIRNIYSSLSLMVNSDKFPKECVKKIAQSAFKNQF